MRGFIIAGNDTNVGKTLVSAILAKAFQADYWKAIEAGGDDTQTVKRLSGCFCHPPAYSLKHPVSPHHAAPLEGITIDLAKIRLPDTPRPLIIEGSGGVMTPLNENNHLGELFIRFGLPWIIVSKHYLGSINHTLLSIEWLLSQGQIVKGVIFNGKPYPEAETYILNRSQLPCLGRLLPEPLLDARRIQWYANQFHPLLNAI